MTHLFLKTSLLSASIAGLFLLGAPSITAQQMDAAQVKAQAETEEEAALPKGTFTEVKGDHAVGDKDAPAQLIIYASNTCPHCAQWFKEVWPTLKKDYVETGKLRFIFREFPTAPAQLAVANFVIASCGDENTYIDAIEYQMASQDKILKILQDKELDDATKIEKVLQDRADQVGLSVKARKECLSTESNYAPINAAVDRARAAKINSVPGFILNGALYEPEPNTLDTLSTAIDALIADK